MIIDSVVKTETGKMEKAVDGIRHELMSIRTGKASPSILETLQVEAYGTRMPLNQLSTISAPEPRLLVVQPFDKTIAGAISKAIQSGSLGLNPSSDGNVIRVPIPQLNEERRKDLVRMVHEIIEKGKVSVRHSRKEANDEIKKMQKEGRISEDEEHLGFDEVQKMTDKFIEKMDELCKAKEEEIMEI